ncbi:MAG TPA: hypothetical protein VN605_12640 [Thermoanaerobaculia bacterium]|nr:hypothetical protein [Thermoanaerobaculia bacterium]
MPARKPSSKQAKAMANLLENGGNVTKAMRDANFSPATANSPKNRTESKAFKTYFADRIPDDLLATRHPELLNKREVVKTFSHDTGETEVEITDQTDTQAYERVLRRYAQENHEEACAIELFNVRPRDGSHFSCDCLPWLVVE